MNPEFRRNLWLEFSDHRLVALPVILGAIFLLVFLFNGRDLDQNTGMIAAFMYIVVIFLWGTRLAAESVLEEVNNRTWDLQRMSAIGAWQMAWGKLFGSTSYAWYGALICLGFYVISYESILPPVALLIAVALYVGSGVLAHAICLLVSLQAIQRRRAFGRVQVMSYQFLGLICALPPLYAGLSGYGEDGIYRVTTWYGEPFPLSVTMVLALAAFVAWSLIGVYALMRVELQQANKPWLWLGFVVFAMVYFAGIRYLPWGLPAFLAPLPGVPTAAYVVALIAAYIMVLGEPKDRVHFRRLGHFYRARQWGQVFDMAPRSVLTLPILLVAGTTVAMLSKVTVVQDFISVVEVRVAVTASMLFVLRDVAFIYFMSLGYTDGRGDGRAVLYLVLLYTVVPALLSALHLKPLVAFFWPQYGQAPMLTLLPIVAEVIGILYLLHRRWRAGLGAAAPAAAE
ncbi:MAG: hypothetical protein RIB59_04115 [Rhodospirillales bacterium]